MDQRKPNRLKGYDYSQNGYYFVTICTYGRQEWFGKISNGDMELNTNGCIVSACWNDLPNHYRNVELDEFIVMPNHVHGIIGINNVGNGLKPFPTTDQLIPSKTKNHGLSEIIRGLKTFSSRRINGTIESGNKFHWQKSFYDHIIRNELSLNRIREYIVNNPRNWNEDEENIFKDKGNS
ncbi:MAG: transposase [Candidatus Omnitrophica bacterium]|nr:transposase [Candidatus Omnitrophota bacterium]